MAYTTANQVTADKGHPPALFILFFTEMWERFSYYGMRALLVLFLTSTLLEGGWGWDRAEALRLYGIYTGLVYLTPILGGLIADKLLGYRKAVILGAFVMTVGHASMALETPFFFYMGLGCLIIGNGLFKPNISSIVGQLYTDNPKKKDAAYTIFYMGINIGALLAPLTVGFLAKTQTFKNILSSAGFDPNKSWHWGFAAAGIGMIVGLIVYQRNRRHLAAVLAQDLRQRGQQEQRPGAQPLQHVGISPVVGADHKRRADRSKRRPPSQ